MLVDPLWWHEICISMDGAGAVSPVINVIMENTMNTAQQRQAIADQQTFPRRNEPMITTIRGIQSTEPSAEMARLMEPVTVTSTGYIAALDITPKNAMQAAKLAAIMKRGPTYESIVFFHPTASRN